MNQKKKFPPGAPFLYHPWPYFLVFLLSDLLLDRSQDHPVSLIWILLLGFVIPLGVALVSLSPPAPRSEKSFSPGWWPLGAFPLVTLAALAWPLGPERAWVGSDNIQPGIYAIHLLTHWNWHFFETFGQTPSTGSYCCFLFLKLGLPPALAYGLPCFVLSLGSVVLAYLAFRKFLPARTSFLFLCLLGFNAWTLSVSRNLILLPFWESLLLYACSRFLTAEAGKDRRIAAGFLGAVLGTGPFAFPSWPIVVPWVIPLVLYRAAGRERRDPWLVPILLAFLLPGLTPFLIAAYREGYGGHILGIAFWNGSSGAAQLKVVGDYLQGVFGWGRPSSLSGTGFLDPLGRAFFLLGCVELLRSRREPWTYWVWLAFFLGWLPGFLSNTVEFNRALLVLPFLVLICSLGAGSLVAHFPLPKKEWGLALLLFWTFSSRFTTSFPSGDLPASVSSVIDEEKICGRTLESLAKTEGPGWILSDFIPYPEDHSLNFYSYSFNAALNPALSGAKVSWCALFTEDHFEPYLRQEFPEARWKHFQNNDPRLKSRHVLALIPLNGSNRSRLESWKDLHRTIEGIDFAVMDLSNGRPRNKVLESLGDLASSLPQDPFLRSCLFEKLAFHYSWEKTFHPEDLGTNWAAYGGLFRRSIAHGVQDAELYEKWGKLLVLEGQWDEAQAAFRRALKFYPGNPWLTHELEAAAAHRPVQ